MIQTASHDPKWLQQKPPVGSTIDWSHPLARGLLACFLFNESQGRGAYNLVPWSGKSDGASSSLSQRASIFSGSLYLEPGNRWTRAQFGPGFSFDGSAIWADAGLPGWSLGANYTVLVWHRPAVVNVAMILACQRHTGNANIWFQLDQNNADARMLFGSGAYAVATYTSAFTAGKWYQQVGTRSGNTAQVYVNGVAGTSATTADSVSGNFELIFGTWDGFNAWYNGVIDHVMIWNRTLLPPEVQWLYEEPFAFVRPLVPRHSVKMPSVGTGQRSFAVIVG